MITLLLSDYLNMGKAAPKDAVIVINHKAKKQDLKKFLKILKSGTAPIRCLAFSSINKFDITPILSALKYYPSLNQLSFEHMSISDSGWRAISDLLIRSRSLTFLSLYNLDISISSLTSLAVAVRNSRTLEKLSISIRACTDKALAASLATNRSLLELKSDMWTLSFRYPTSREMRYHDRNNLISELAHNQTLRRIALGAFLDDPNTPMSQEELKEGTSLVTTVVPHRSLQHMSSQSFQFFRLPKQHPINKFSWLANMRTLNLTACAIDDEHVGTVTRILRETTVLETFVLGDSNLSQAGVATVLNALAYNQSVITFIIQTPAMMMRNEPPEPESAEMQELIKLTLAIQNCVAQNRHLQVLSFRGFLSTSAPRDIIQNIGKLFLESPSLRRLQFFHRGSNEQAELDDLAKAKFSSSVALR